MSKWFAAALALVGLVLLIRLLVEWRRYAAGKHIITRRQIILRVVSGILLIVLLVLIGVGLRVNFGSATAVFVYWGVCLSMAFSAMIMALWDLRLLKRISGRRRAESYRRLSQYIRRLERGRDSQVPRP